MRIEFESIDEVLAFAGRLQAPAEVEKAPAEEKAPEVEKAPAEAEKAPAEEKAPFSGVSESDVRVVFAEKLKGGKKAEVKEIFARYGVTKLSELLEKHGDKLNRIYKEASEI